MNMRTKSLYPYGGQLLEADIFGYSTKGIPGIEIVGMGKYSRSLKEKFIYLSKEKNLRFPLKRFVLCVEGELEGKKFKEEEFRYLELPLLIMLWSLTGHLLLGKLEDCFSAGKVNVEGEVESLDLNAYAMMRIEEIFSLENESFIKVIAPEAKAPEGDFYHLPLEELWSSIGKNKGP